MKRFVLFVALAIAAPCHVQAQQDQVFGRKGTPTRGTISAISATTITLLATGVNRDFEVKDVLKVTFGDDPAELRNARDQLLDGQYQNALDQLNKIDAAAIQNAVIKQDVGYYKVYCNAQLATTAGGDRKAAAAALRAFLGENRNSYHFFEGAEMLGNLYLAVADYQNAATFHGLLAKAPWPEYQMKAAVLAANSLVAAGKYDEALPGFQQVSASGLNTPEAMEQKLHASVGTAVCMAAAGQHEQGIKLIEDLIAKNDPTDAELFGRAYNALGACYEKAGKTKEALLAYLHTDVLFYSNGDTHAEALYHLSKLRTAVNHSDRAVRARSLLSSRYPGSRYASME